MSFYTEFSVSALHFANMSRPSPQRHFLFRSFPDASRMRGFSVSRSPSPTPGRSGSLGPPSARFSESPGRDAARDALLDVEKISFNGVSHRIQTGRREDWRPGGGYFPRTRGRRCGGRVYMGGGLLQVVFICLCSNVNMRCGFIISELIHL